MYGETKESIERGIEETIEKALEHHEGKEYDVSFELLEILRRSKNIGAHSPTMRIVYALQACSSSRMRWDKKVTDLCNKVIDVAKDSDIVNIIAYNVMASVMARRGKEDIAEIYTMFSMKMLSSSPDNPKKEWVAGFIMPDINRLGIAFIQSGNNAGAIRILGKAKELSEWLESSDDSEIRKSAVSYSAECGFLYATALELQGRHREAREQFNAILRRYRVTANFRGIAKTFSAIAKTFEEEGNWPSASAWFRDAINVWSSIGDKVKATQAEKDMDRVSELLAKEEEKSEDVSPAPELGESSGAEGLYT